MRLYRSLFSFFYSIFEQLRVNLTPLNIYMEEECGMNKRTECSNLKKSGQAYIYMLHIFYYRFLIVHNNF